MNRLATGSAGLDDLLGKLRPGDNVVWRIDDAADYLHFARRLIDAVTEAARTAAAVKDTRHLVYFRFSDDEPILKGCSVGCEEVAVPLDRGFENFITTVHEAITRYADTGVFLFDNLSTLSDAYYSDRMIGNFFQLTCPYVYELGAVAYFALSRYRHSYHAAEPITNTTQVLLDLYRHNDEYYIQPVKTTGRGTDSTFLLYHCEEYGFTPIKESARISQIINTTPWPGLRSTSYRMVGVWDRVFMDAEHVQHQIDTGRIPEEDAADTVDRLLTLIISREERVAALARKYFTLADIIAIWKRMIGTGLIGGKSIGMLLSRAILQRNSGKWRDLLEEHDSFFIGSDVYYTYLVINNVWWERQQQKDPDSYLEPEAAGKILSGKFPDYIVDRFVDMLDYFGKSPIIVRSSSLMEDNFGNAFAGKYASVFCTNQGSREQRLHEFLAAVRHVYASSVNDDALTYRKTRGLLDQDEQMALLVQRVSGAPYGDLFFPQLAGVAFSFNPYTWSKGIDARAGMVRLVFGLGTRAVDRADDDYTRVVALNAPEKRPESSFKEVRQHAQRRVDVLDFSSRRHRSIHFVDLLKRDPDLSMQLFATRDRELVRDRNVDSRLSWVLTFEKVLRESTFVSDMAEILATVREAYETEIDVEFTANFLRDGSYKIDVVQCRPLQVQGVHLRSTPLPDLSAEQIVLEAHGGVVGHSRVLAVGRIVYVRPHAYSRLSEADKYRLTEVIGTVTHAPIEQNGAEPLHQVLIGPGRWGTSTPSLGIPVNFSHIDRASVLVEIDTIHEGLIADLSLGTHFFNEMVEMNLLYLAFFSGRKENRLQLEYLEGARNQLVRIAPDLSDWAHVVTVVEPASDTTMMLNADSRNQVGVLYTAS